MQVVLYNTNTTPHPDPQFTGVPVLQPPPPPPPGPLVYIHTPLSCKLHIFVIDKEVFKSLGQALLHHPDTTPKEASRFSQHSPSTKCTNCFDGCLTCLGVAHAGALQHPKAHVAQEGQVLGGAGHRHPIPQPIHQQGPHLTARVHDDVIPRSALWETAATLHLL